MKGEHLSHKQNLVLKGVYRTSCKNHEGGIPHLVVTGALSESVLIVTLRSNNPKTWLAYIKCAMVVVS